MDLSKVEKVVYITLINERENHTLVLSPSIRHPGSHLLEQFRSIDQRIDGDVVFSVTENLFTCQHLRGRRI